MSTAAREQRENFAGLVERVTFHNPDNGFCVLRVKARGQRDPITVVGHAPVISAGEFVQATGTWTNDRTHGPQFKATFLRAAPPTTLEGIERYLGSGMIRGIGPIYAKRLVRAFGEAVFDVIEDQPERLREVDGIGPKRAGKIIGGWADQKVIREIMIFLHSHGVSTSRAVRIFKIYGADAIQVLSENPYRLARDVRGIGFKTPDAIAPGWGSRRRMIRAAPASLTTEAMDDGHCGLPLDEPMAEQLLEIPALIVEQALTFELEAGEVVADTVGGRRCIFLAGLYRAERAIADRLRPLQKGGLPWPYIDPAKAIPWVEDRAGITLAESQRAALRLALLSKVLVITGGPGVGKTTLINSILKVLGRQGHRDCAGGAHRPCGEAAQREHWPRGQDHPPPARGRSQAGQLPAQRGESARVRSAGRRRDIDGRRATDARRSAGRARARRADPGRRRRPAAVGRPGPGTGGHHRTQRRCRSCG